METRKICVISGSRADYGYLANLMGLVREDPRCELQTVATGMHLWPEFGETCCEIEAGGFPLAARVAVPLVGTGAGDVARAVGRLVEGFANALGKLCPDFAVVLGDRYEIFAAAQACLFLRVPVVHLAGGDVTEGAYDEAMRHSITKMASLHFVTTPQAARRVEQLGEDPARIHCVGATCLDRLATFPLLSKDELAAQLGFNFKARNLLVTFHPVTLAATSSVAQMDELLAALDDLAADGDTGILCTAPNADTEGLELMARLLGFAATRPHTLVRASLGQLHYFSAVRACDAVVGNSSSGIYEVPSLKRPTVDIGERQQGRLLAASVVHCEPRREDIRVAVERALALDCSSVVNPYGDGQASRRILDVLMAVPDPRALVRKRFHDLT